MRVRSLVLPLCFATCVVLLLVLGMPARGADTIQWKNIGPGGGGNMLSASVSPVDPNIVLQGSDVGGIYRSGDGGVTWSLRNGALVNPTRNLRYGFYTHFGFDPVNPTNVYFGPLRSTDTGINWSVNIDESQMSAWGAVVDPDSPNIVYTGGGYANIYRSSDRWASSQCKGTPTTTPGSETVCSTSPSGATCLPNQRCYQASCLPYPGSGPSAPGCSDNYNFLTYSVVLDPTVGAADPYNQRRLIACTDQGLFQSTDSATTWTKMTPTAAGGSPEPLPSPLKCVSMVLYRKGGSVSLFMATRTQPVNGPAYSPTWTDIDTWRGGLYRSTDWGATWTSINGTDDANVIYNPGFEIQGATSADADGWTRNPPAQVSRTCTQSHSGSCSMQFAGTDPDQTINVATPPAGIPDNTVPVVGGTLYKLSAWYKVTGGTGWDTYTKVWWYDVNKQAINWPGLLWNSIEPWYRYTDPGTPITYDWTRFEALIRPPDAARYAYIEFRTAAGAVLVDDVSLRPTHMLPKLTGYGTQPYFVTYSDLVVDPLNDQVLYTGTERGSFLEVWPIADVGGIWKTTDGGLTWNLSTRRFWHDNVLDNGTSNPVCGDNVCGGRWETCTTCPQDCADNEPGPPTACCGNGVCQSPAESKDNCIVDCPFDPDPSPRPYYENDHYDDIVNGYYYGAPRGNGPYYPWALAIGGGANGHNTLYFGAEHLKTTDGGATWSEVTSNAYTGGDSDLGTLAGRGDPNDVFAFWAVHDTRAGRNWLFYGDTDDTVQVSYNGGKSFAQLWPRYYDNDPNTIEPPVYGDAVTSIVLDPDPAHNTRVFLGMSAGAADIQWDSVGGGCDGVGCAGAVQGEFTPGVAPAVGTWSWDVLGDQSTFPKTGGGVELLRTSTGTFFAAVFGRGVYKLTPPITGSTPWVNTFTGANWSPVPDGWELNHIIQEPTTGRLYVAAGTSGNAVPTTSNQTGVWESSDGGASWHRVNDTGTGTGSGMDKEPVHDVIAANATTLFVATWYGYQVGCSTNPCPSWDGDGGLYKGTRSGETWTWSKVLAQPLVETVIKSPASSSILYALAGQNCCAGIVPGQMAGIYKSVDSGTNWTLLQNNGLGRLAGKFYYAANDNKKLYATTIGDGVFEGTITCGPTAEGFTDSDGDLNPDCSDTNLDPTIQITMTEGSIVSGTIANLKTDDDVYEVLKETTTGTRKMTKVWTFNVPTGKPIELRVAAFRSETVGADNFNFSFVAKASGTCSSGDAFGSTVLTVSKTTDDDLPQTVSLGTISNPVLCLRVQDSKRTGTDNQTDQLSIDQLYLYQVLACVDNDGDGYTPGCTSCTNALCPAVDCDDADPLENPGLTEGVDGTGTCSDTKDNNCNGLTDAADTAVCTSHVLVELPNSDAGPNQGTPSPAVAHYLDVDDDPNDGDTSTLSFSNGGNKEVYTTADQLLDTDVVTNVKVRWVAKKGSGSGWTAKAGVVIGPTEYYGTTRTLATNYTQYEESFATNPDTTQAWTVSAVRAAKLIYQQVTINQALPRAKLTEIVLVVTVLR